MAEPPVDISSSSLSRSKWARDSLGLRSGLSLRCGLVFLAVACAEAFVLGLCILTGPLGEGAATVVGLHLTSSQTGREEFHALASKPLAFLCLYPLESSEQGSFYYSDKFPVPKLGSKIVTQAVSELLRAVRAQSGSQCPSIAAYQAPGCGFLTHCIIYSSPLLENMEILSHLILPQTKNGSTS